MNWWDEHIDNWKSYIRSYGEGVGFPSREWFANHIDPSWSILDVGCGGGIEYESLVNHHPNIKYVGTDYCESAVNASKELFPGVDFRVEDARSLASLPDGGFDCVLIRHTLDHIDRWDDALRAAYRVARKEVVVILWAATFDGNREPSFQDHGNDCCFRQFSTIHLTNWIVLNLKPSSVTINEVTAENVPGRSHRKDTCFTIKKPLCQEK